MLNVLTRGMESGVKNANFKDYNDYLYQLEETVKLLMQVEAFINDLIQKMDADGELLEMK